MTTREEQPHDDEAPASDAGPAPAPAPAPAPPRIPVSVRVLRAFEQRWWLRSAFGFTFLGLGIGLVLVAGSGGTDLFAADTAPAAGSTAPEGPIDPGIAIPIDGGGAIDAPTAPAAPAEPGGTSPTPGATPGSTAPTSPSGKRSRIYLVQYASPKEARSRIESMSSCLESADLSGTATLAQKSLDPLVRELIYGSASAGAPLSPRATELVSSFDTLSVVAYTILDDAKAPYDALPGCITSGAEFVMTSNSPSNDAVPGPAPHVAPASESSAVPVPLP